MSYDLFKIERERLRQALIPNLVSMDYAKDWEERKQRMYELMKQYQDEVKATLSVSTVWEEKAPLELKPASVTQFPQVNLSELIEVPE